MSVDFINSEASTVCMFINNYNVFVHERIQETIKYIIYTRKLCLLNWAQSCL